MTRAEYNAKVQDMQRFCIECGLQHRVRPEMHKPTMNARGYNIIGGLPIVDVAKFEVYYGGWRTLGWQEHPMTDQVSFDYLDSADAQLRAEVARDLCN